MRKTEYWQVVREGGEGVWSEMDRESRRGGSKGCTILFSRSVWGGIEEHGWKGERAIDR